MSETGYKTVYQGGIGEIEEKKSRFIASIEPVTSEEEAVAFFNKKKKEYWDARHNCTAFTIGEKHENTRCNDDGEPSGTAGRPMLDVLLREDIHNVAVVVTRYFGGTLLGTGGLVRAYQKSVQEGLKNSVIIERHKGCKLTISTDYTGLGKIQYILASANITTLDTEYTEGVCIHTMVPSEQLAALQNDITQGTSGQAKMEPGDPVEYAILDGEVLLF
ncbi:MAG: YigZ family protein [bacterium]|nr:YigZ family protein [bacterium]MDY4101205.1 YigZ family protein [Lachnospiraceae bacterium]